MQCDVAVVGAGPAGSSCAYRLARAGHSVTIFERSAFPRTKVCGEYIGAAACSELRDIGIGDIVHDEAFDIRGIRLHTQGTAVELAFPQTAWSLARADLDALLLRHALDAGAGLITARVESVTQTPRGATISFRDVSGTLHTMQARTVVGADGIGSQTARSLGLAMAQRRNARFAVGGHYAGFGNLGRYIETYVQGGTYFAINPLGPDIANVMVVVDESRLREWRGAIDERLRETARDLAEGRRDVGAVERVGKRVAIGPLTQRVRHVARERAYLVGDASGFMDPFTGQGVYLALKTAALASASIIREFAGGAQARNCHRDYIREHRRIFAARGQVTKLVSLLIKTPWLAKRAAHSLQINAALRAAVIESVSGHANPYAVLSPATLLRLVL